MKMFLSTAIALVAFQASADHHTVAPECTTIVDQCTKAGFIVGDFTKEKKAAGTPTKGLWHDCVKVVATGGTVTGVTVAKADAEKCIATHKEAKAAHKATH